MPGGGGGAIDPLPLEAILGLGPLSAVVGAVPEAIEGLGAAPPVLAAMAAVALGVGRTGGTIDARGPVPIRESRDVGLRAMDGRATFRAAAALLGLFF